MSNWCKTLWRDPEVALNPRHDAPWSPSSRLAQPTEPVAAAGERGLAPGCAFIGTQAPASAPAPGWTERGPAAPPQTARGRPSRSASARRSASPRSALPAPREAGLRDVEQGGGLALGPLAAPVVAGGGLEVGVPGQLLHGGQVGPGVQQVGDEGAPEVVRARRGPRGPPRPACARRAAPPAASGARGSACCPCGCGGRAGRARPRGRRTSRAGPRGPRPRRRSGGPCCPCPRAR